ncbi:hypothetical protein Tco_1075212 [Tanacetum coccineum]
MGSHTLQQLKKLSFDEVKELFETTMKMVNTFTPMESNDIVPKVVAGSSKRDVEQELNQESSKRQKIGEGSESDEESKDELLKKVLEDHQSRFNSTEPIEDKERELWVELKRLFEPDDNDILWKLQRYMHEPLKWRLYDTCVVHHVSTERGHDIFMLVEKDYPLTRALMTLMLSNKLQVDEYSVMADELLRAASEWFRNGGELPGMVQVRCMTYFQDHKWYDKLADGKIKEETLALKAKVEGSRMLVKGDAHEIALFTHMENRQYANMKTEKTHDPYLDVNCIFGRNY